MKTVECSKSFQETLLICKYFNVELMQIGEIAVCSTAKTSTVLFPQLGSFHTIYISKQDF